MIMSQCAFCGQLVDLVHVHGHYQCPVCKTNAMPCCDGDNCDTNVLLNEDPKLQTFPKEFSEGVIGPLEQTSNQLTLTAVPVATTISILPLAPTVSKSRSIPTTALAP